MTSISNLSAQNSSFILQYGNFSDFNIFIFFIMVAILLTIISRFLPQKDESGKFIIAVLGVLIAASTIWMSLGVAHFNYNQGGSMIENVTDNLTITHEYIYPVQQVVSSPALTIICVIITIFCVLSTLDIFFTIIQKAPEQASGKNGPGFNIDGKRIRYKEDELR